MAIQAPTHAERRHLSDPFHLVDATVAADAADSGGDMRAVWEIRVVGELVDPNPAHRPATLRAIANRCQRLAIPFDRLVAVHAHLRGRNVGDVRNFNRRVTVPTIQTELADVEPMAVRDRLNRLVAHVCVPRRKVVPDASGRERRTENDRDGGNDRELVPPRWENLTQWLGPPGAGVLVSRPRVRDTPMMTHVAPPKNLSQGMTEIPL